MQAPLVDRVTPNPVVEADDACLLHGFISRFTGNSVALLMKESPLTKCSKFDFRCCVSEQLMIKAGRAA